MNGFSWLLYGTQVAGNVGSTAGLVCMIAGMAAGAGGLASFAFGADGYAEVQASAAKLTKVAVAVFVVSGLLAVFTPSKDTLMLIAASEVGETVLASKNVQAIGGEAGALASDSLKLLRKYVTDQLNAETTD